jgi:hypothetical protein
VFPVAHAPVRTLAALTGVTEIRGMKTPVLLAYHNFKTTEIRIEQKFYESLTEFTDKPVLG